jgi:hypothetical protein
MLKGAGEGRRLKDDSSGPQSRPGNLPKIEHLFADGNHLNIGNAGMD